MDIQANTKDAIVFLFKWDFFAACKKNIFPLSLPSDYDNTASDVGLRGGPSRVGFSFTIVKLLFVDEAK